MALSASGLQGLAEESAGYSQPCFNQVLDLVVNEGFSGVADSGDPGVDAVLKRFAAITALSHSSTKFVLLCEKLAPEYSSIPFRKIPVTNDTHWNGTVAQLEVFLAEWKVINGALGAYVDSRPKKKPPSKLNQYEIDLASALQPILASLKVYLSSPSRVREKYSI